MATFALNAEVTLVTALIAVRTGMAEGIALAQVASSLLTGLANFVVIRRFTRFNLSLLVLGILRVGLPCIVKTAALVLFQGMLEHNGMDEIFILEVCALIGASLFLAVARVTSSRELGDVFSAICSQPAGSSLGTSDRAHNSSSKPPF